MLEAYWMFDERAGSLARDASGHGEDGRFSHEPKRASGVRGGAVRLDGADDYLRIEQSSALRLTGSMTVSAWINSSAFPADDAAIVSSHGTGGGAGAGYQLDTTVDRGPRTVGFKLFNECGDLVARYGATPLVVNRWYHVAGVYDAQTQRLDVYLNGRVDNGVLIGSVTRGQRSSRRPTYVGRRSDGRGFEFAGLIDEVRIYSRALTKAEIAADMQGAVSNDPPPRPADGSIGGTGGAPGRCAWASDREDARLPGGVAVFGVLVGVAAIAFWPSMGGLAALGVSLIGGIALVALTAPTLPPINTWAIPLTSLAGGASAAASIRRRNGG
jgi:hypothetical protein